MIALHVSANGRVRSYKNISHIYTNKGSSLVSLMQKVIQTQPEESTAVNGTYPYSYSFSGPWESPSVLINLAPGEFVKLEQDDYEPIQF